MSIHHYLVYLVVCFFFSPSPRFPNSFSSFWSSVVFWTADTVCQKALNSSAVAFWTFSNEGVTHVSSFWPALLLFYTRAIWFEKRIFSEMKWHISNRVEGDVWWVEVENYKWRDREPRIWRKESKKWMNVVAFYVCMWRWVSVLAGHILQFVFFFCKC